MKNLSEKIYRMLEEGKVDKSRIVYHIEGIGGNQDLLEKSVKKSVWGNLTAVLALDLSDDSPQKEQVEMRLTKDWLRWMKIKEEEFWKLADQNTPRCRPAVLRPLELVLREMIGKMAVASGNEELKKEILADSMMHHRGYIMYVLPNRSGVHGAAAVLYPGILKLAAERIGGDLLVLPSSVHEVILLKWEEEIQLRKAAELVRSINRTIMQQKDVLADSAYIYRRASERIEGMNADGEMIF